MFGHVYHLHFLFLKEPDNFGWASVFLLFFSNFRLISSYFVLVTIITFDLVLHITHINIYHPRGVFLAGFGWFEGNILYFNIQIRVYHILFTDRTTDYVAAEDFDGLHRSYFIAKFLLSLCILFIHCSFV